MSTPDKSDQDRAEALAWLQETTSRSEVDRGLSPYLDAAAVLSTFQLKKIKPAAGAPPQDPTETLMALTDRCQFVDTPDRDTWQLKDSLRHEILHRLRTPAAMRQARTVNEVPPGDPIQDGIDLLLTGEKILLDRMTFEQLLGLERASQWFEETEVTVPQRTDLVARIDRERLFAPMNKIAGEGFVDRVDFLRQLSDYVGVLPADTVFQSFRRGVRKISYQFIDRPPIHIHAPGGMGKSSLLARFILDHARPGLVHPMPFVYLDFDRGSLDPREPATLLTDAIRQLLTQFPAIARDFELLSDEARESFARSDSVERSKSSHYGAAENFIRRFRRLVEAIAEQNDQPVVIILDTLEEAEYHGASAMHVTWSLLQDLLRQVSRLRIVTAGRSPLSPRLRREPIELTELPDEAAVQLIVQRTRTLPGGPITASDARKIVDLVGAVPLSLMLASRVVIREGLDALRDTVRRRSLFVQIKTEEQQGMLYRRILGHVRTHNPQLERVANPGLILRRITPEVIEHILAGPCKLALRRPHDSYRLFEALARETGLVDPYREPGALWHLSAVRRVMLPKLREELGTLATDLHRAAAIYYARQPGLIARAEQLYHRLWLDEDFAQLDALWQPELGPQLRSAYEELAPAQKIWLGDKLGIELDSELREQASYAIWARQTEQRAQTLLTNGLAREALEAVRERPRSAEVVSLLILETDILKLLGLSSEAVKVLRFGLQAATERADGHAIMTLLLRLSFLLEARGELEASFQQAAEAAQTASHLKSPLDYLSACAAMLRLIRKLDSSLADDSMLDLSEARKRVRNSVQRGALGVLEDSEILHQVSLRPALLQELAAELGFLYRPILVTAVSTLGISPEDQLALREYAQGRLGDLDKSQQRTLEQLGRRKTSRGIGREVAALVPAFPEFFVRRFARTVEDSLHRTLSAPLGEARSVLNSAPRKLDSYALSKISDVLASVFNPSEIALLTRDIFDVELDSLALRGVLAPFKGKLLALLEYAQNRGAFESLLIRLVRSRPDNEKLKKIAQEAFAPSEVKKNSELKRPELEM